MSAENPTPREFAALMCALATTRGQLSSVLLDSHNKEEIARALAGTSLSNIAATIGTRAEALAVDWSEHLTDDEQRSIQGATER